MSFYLRLSDDELLEQSKQCRRALAANKDGTDKEFIQEFFGDQLEQLQKESRRRLLIRKRSDVVGFGNQLTALKGGKS